MNWKYVQKISIPDNDIERLKAFLDGYYGLFASFGVIDRSVENPYVQMGDYNLLLTSDPSQYTVDIETSNGIFLGVMELQKCP